MACLLVHVDITSLAFGTDVRLRVLGGSNLTDHGDHLVVRTPMNPDFHWGNFILVAATARRDSQHWISVFGTTFPDARHIAIGLDTTIADAAVLAEFAAAELTPDISTVLTASRLLRPARPAGDVEVRMLASDDDWTQALELRRAVYPEDGPAGQSFLDRSVMGSRLLSTVAHGAWFGAYVGSQLRASLGLFADAGRLARYQNVETHPEYRRRGLASWLIYHAGRYAMKDLGARTLVIVADPEYHAISLYRILGFTDTEQQVQLNGRR
jgi:ribosomal protein S18 acetylase RimI-like enzyme